MKTVNLIGIDLAKNNFWMRAEDQHGNCLVNRRVRREKLFEAVTLLKPEMIAFEACGGSHYWGRRFQEAGFKVMVIAPQYVKPYRRGEKNDSNDSFAICEAARRPNLPTVTVKTLMHQDLQLALRDRESLVGRRTEVLNAMRGMALEYGFCFAKGSTKLIKAIHILLQEDKSSIELKEYLKRCLQRIQNLEEEIQSYDRKFNLFCKKDGICKKLVELAGVGVITAIAVRCSVVNPNDFKNGRQLAAFFGLVPRQNSSGEKIRMGRLAKDGNKYIRQLLIHGGRSVVRVADKKTDPLSQWASKKFKEKGFNKACVAVANKNARMLWAVMAKQPQEKLVA